MSSDELDDVEDSSTTIVGGIELTKSTSTPTVTNTATGTQATYTITLTNQVATATTVTVTDVLPQGFTYNATTGGATGCTLPEFQPAPDPNVPIWSGCTLTASGTLTITFTATVAATVGEGTYQNPVSGTSPALSVLPFDEINTTAEDVTVIVPYDLQVTKTVQSFDGTTVIYLITATNVGINNMTNIVINDVLPGLVTYQSSSATQGTYDQVLGNWTVLAPGAFTINAPSQVIEPPLVGQNYTCIQSHTAGPTNQPGVGANWQDYWEVGGAAGTPTWAIGNPYNAAGSDTLTITATVAPFTSTVQNCASLTAPLAPAAGGDSNPANNTGCADLAPTLVTLSDFRAYEDSGRVVVQWTTASEIGTAGFYLLRRDASGEYIQINRRPLPALFTSPQGGTYSLVDKGAAPAGTHTYLLVELEQKGTRLTYGPFTVEVGGDGVAGKLNDSPNPLMQGECGSSSCAGQNSVSSGKINVYYDSAGNPVVMNTHTGNAKEAGIKTRKKAVTDLYENYTRKPHGVSKEKKDRLATFNILKKKKEETRQASTGDVLKIAVDSAGMHYLDASTIAAFFGMKQKKAENMIKNGLLAMHSHGQPVAYLPADGNAGLYFYAEPVETLYTNKNIYWLEQGKGVQMQAVNGQGPSSTGQGSFTDTVHSEENLWWAPELFIDPEVDFWMWDYLIGGWAPYDQKTFPIEVHGIAQTDILATLTVNLQGFTELTPLLDHHAVVSMNGHYIGEGQFDGIEQKPLSIPFDQGLLQEGVNTIEVKAVLDPGVPYDVFYVNSFDLTYQRSYQASEDVLVFRGEGNPLVTVEGFTSPDISVFDISNPRTPVLVQEVTSGGGQGDYRVSLEPASPEATYLAVSAAGLVTGFDFCAEKASSLSSPDNWADYLIITPEELGEAAQELAAYRQSQGLETMVVFTEDIMDEFNYGIESPQAIRDFIGYAYASWNKPPRYIVLAGDGSFDYKNYRGYSENLVPVMLTTTPLGLFPSDNLYADVDGDHVPDVALGRLPVLTPQEIRDMLGKMQAFEGSARDRVIFLADDPDTGGNFPADSDDIAMLVPPSYQKEKIYLLNPGQISTVRTQLLEEINKGALLVNYIGHAAYSLLSYDGILYPEDLDSWTNYHGLPVLTAMTCVVGMYAYPGLDTLTEAMVLKADGGAVASWAPTGLSYNSLSKILDEEFFRAAFDETDEILGDVILEAFEGYDARGGPVYVMDIYNLQGDPALKLR
jgi:uncharacterized repeat protein (TIGR01451 family)